MKNVKLRRIIFVLLTFLLMAALLPAVAAADDNVGLIVAGPPPESGKTYSVSTVEQLNYLASLVNAGNSLKDSTFVLQNDVTINNASSYAPIGIPDPAWEAKPFRGVFDGDGHTVTFADIDAGGANYGVFGYNMGTVKNLTVDGTITRGGSFTGGVAAVNKGLVENCTSNANIAGGSATGGVAGYNRGTIRLCAFGGSVKGATFVGGIAGVTGISGSDANLIEECRSTGSVTAMGNAGGILGCVYFDATVKNCYSTGDISGGYTAGGILGSSTRGSFRESFTHCYSTAKVSGDDCGGGVFGSVGYGDAASNCAAFNATVSGSGSVGSIYGLTTAPNKTGMFVRSDIVLTPARAVDGEDIIKSGDPEAVAFEGWDSSIWDMPNSTYEAGEQLPRLSGFRSDDSTNPYPTVPRHGNTTLYFNAADGMLYTDASYSIVFTDMAKNWSGDGNRLTLDGFHFATSAQCALVMPSNSELVLTGSNSITNVVSNAAESAALCAQGDADGTFAISGGGELDLTALVTATSTSTVYGANINANLEQQDASVFSHVDGGTNHNYGMHVTGKLTLSGASELIAAAGDSTADTASNVYDSIGLHANELELGSGARLTAVGQDNALTLANSAALPGKSTQAASGFDYDDFTADDWYSAPSGLTSHELTPANSRFAFYSDGVPATFLQLTSPTYIVIPINIPAQEEVSPTGEAADVGEATCERAQS